MTFLRAYFKKNPAKFYWRATLMCVMVAMLCLAVIPLGHFDFPAQDPIPVVKPSYYAICFYKTGMSFNTGGFQSMIQYIVLSIYGITIRLAKMISPPPRIWRKITSRFKHFFLLASADSFTAGQLEGNVHDVAPTSRDASTSNYIEAFFGATELASAIVALHVDIWTSVLGEVSSSARPM
jgi:hypothetical protein